MPKELRANLSKNDKEGGYSLLNLFKPGGSKRRAMVFVDYESWFYSYKTLYNMRPDPRDFRSKLEAEYNIEDITY